MALPLERLPSLTGSDGDCPSASSVATPSDRSPFMAGQHYSIPIDGIALQPATLGPQHELLPDINDPNTAGKPTRKVCCIGAGYVGGPTAAMIAYHNPRVQVTVVDRDQKRINAWRGRHLPIHEPGLADIVRIARDGERGDDGTFMRQPNLNFSTACAEHIATADIVLISVNTPTKRRGQGAGRATDMTAFEGATRDVATYAKNGCILVEKSTVPCKTGQLMKDIMAQHRPHEKFSVLSNPEFLAEGTAVKDLMCPDRVIIGSESTVEGYRAAAALASLYAAWVPRERIMPINIWSSELCKLTANAMLAQRISSINSISAICEKTGADVNEIAKSVGMDTRIGSKFLKSGLGFGGSCFRKDIASLTYLAESLGLPEVALYWQQVLVMNNFQRDRFALNVIASLNNSLRGKKITILGFAFKKDTGDARESPALDVIRILLEEGPRSIAIYDPLCSEEDIAYELRALAGDGPVMQPSGPIEIFSDPYQACDDSSAVLVLTEWDMFKVQRASPVTKIPEFTPVFENVDPSTPTDILRIERPIGDMHLLDDPPTPPKSPKSALPSVETASRMMPEPDCPADCEECADATRPGKSKRDTVTPLDWTQVAEIVKEPRWVFDGRNILDVHRMGELGFRVKSIGRASDDSM